MGQTAVQAWYQALRPRVFTATYAPMGLAGIIAVNDGVFDAGIFLLALIGTLLLQSAANLINEYADYRRGADQLKEAGQGMTIKKKILKPASVRNGAVLTTVAGCLIGLFLLAQSGPCSGSSASAAFLSPSAIPPVLSHWHIMVWANSLSQFLWDPP